MSYLYQVLNKIKSKLAAFTAGGLTFAQISIMALPQLRRYYQVLLVLSGVQFCFGIWLSALPVLIFVYPDFLTSHWITHRVTQVLYLYEAERTILCDMLTDPTKAEAWWWLENHLYNLDLVTLKLEYVRDRLLFLDQPPPTGVGWYVWWVVLRRGVRWAAVVLFFLVVLQLVRRKIPPPPLQDNQILSPEAIALGVKYRRLTLYVSLCLTATSIICSGYYILEFNPVEFYTGYAPMSLHLVDNHFVQIQRGLLTLATDLTTPEEARLILGQAVLDLNEIQYWTLDLRVRCGYYRYNLTYWERFKLCYQISLVYMIPAGMYVWVWWHWRKHRGT